MFIDGKKLKILRSENEIQTRIKEIGDEINNRFGLDEDVYVISVLKGSVMFTIDLVKKMKTPIIFEVMQVSSYSGTESTGAITVKKDLDCKIEGKDVLIVEDIIDTGYTLRALRQDLLARNPKSLKIAVLLDKKERRKVEVPIDYIGYEIENKFVVGYGFDVDEQGRNIPYIGYIEE